MSLENVEKFFELVKSNENIAKELIKIKDKLQQKDKIFDETQFVKDEIIPIAQKNEIDFTPEEFLSYVRAQISELSDEDLLNVSGGGSLQNFLLGGLLVALSSVAPAVGISSFPLVEPISQETTQNSETRSQTSQGGNDGEGTSEKAKTDSQKNKSSEKKADFKKNSSKKTNKNVATSRARSNSSNRSGTSSRRGTAQDGSTASAGLRSDAENLNQPQLSTPTNVSSGPSVSTGSEDSQNNSIKSFTAEPQNKPTPNAKTNVVNPAPAPAVSPINKTEPTPTPPNITPINDKTNPDPAPAPGPVINHINKTKPELAPVPAPQPNIKPDPAPLNPEPDEVRRQLSAENFEELAAYLKGNFDVYDFENAKIENEKEMTLINFYRNSEVTKKGIFVNGVHINDEVAKTLFDYAKQKYNYLFRFANENDKFNALTKALLANKDPESLLDFADKMNFYGLDMLKNMIDTWQELINSADFTEYRKMMGVQFDPATKFIVKAKKLIKAENSINKEIKEVIHEDETPVATSSFRWQRIAYWASALIADAALAYLGYTYGNVIYSTVKAYVVSLFNNGVPLSEMFNKAVTYIKDYFPSSNVDAPQLSANISANSISNVAGNSTDVVNGMLLKNPVETVKILENAFNAATNSANPGAIASTINKGVEFAANTLNTAASANSGAIASTINKGVEIAANTFNTAASANPGAVASTINKGVELAANTLTHQGVQAAGSGAINLASTTGKEALNSLVEIGKSSLEANGPINVAKEVVDNPYAFNYGPLNMIKEAAEKSNWDFKKIGLSALAVASIYGLYKLYNHFKGAPAQQNTGANPGGQPPADGAAGGNAGTNIDEISADQLQDLKSKIRCTGAFEDYATGLSLGISNSTDELDISKYSAEIQQFIKEEMIKSLLFCNEDSAKLPAKQLNTILISSDESKNNFNLAVKNLSQNSTLKKPGTNSYVLVPLVLKQKNDTKDRFKVTSATMNVYVDDYVCTFSWNSENPYQIDFSKPDDCPNISEEKLKNAKQLFWNEISVNVPLTADIVDGDWTSEAVVNFVNHFNEEFEKSKKSNPSLTKENMDLDNQIGENLKNIVKLIQISPNGKATINNEEIPEESFIAIFDLAHDCGIEYVCQRFDSVSELAKSACINDDNGQIAENLKKKKDKGKFDKMSQFILGRIDRALVKAGLEEPAAIPAPDLFDLDGGNKSKEKNNVIASTDDKEEPEKINVNSSKNEDKHPKVETKKTDDSSSKEETTANLGKSTRSLNNAEKMSDEKIPDFDSDVEYEPPGSPVELDDLKNQTQKISQNVLKNQSEQDNSEETETAENNGKKEVNVPLDAIENSESKIEDASKEEQKVDTPNNKENSEEHVPIIQVGESEAELEDSSNKKPSSNIDSAKSAEGDNEETANSDKNQNENVNTESGEKGGETQDATENPNQDILESDYCGSISHEQDLKFTLYKTGELVISANEDLINSNDFIGELSDSTPFDNMSDENKAMVKTVTIKDGVKAIKGCEQPKDTTLRDFSAYKSCFRDFKNLNKVNIEGTTMTEIGEGAFNGCKGLESATIPDCVTKIEKNAFSETKLKSINIPDNVKKIGDYAFALCLNLSEFNMPNNLEEIGSYAFWSCAASESIVIPDKVTKIGKSAFLQCLKLQSITIPSSVISIGTRAFCYCTKLKTIYFKGTNNPANGIVLFARNEGKVQPSTIIFVLPSFDGNYFGCAKVTKLAISAGSTNDNDSGSGPSGSDFDHGPGYTGSDNDSSDFNIEKANKTEMRAESSDSEKNKDDTTAKRTNETDNNNAPYGSEEKATGQISISSDVENKKTDNESTLFSDSEQKENKKTSNKNNDDSTLIDNAEKMSDENIPDFDSDVEDESQDSSVELNDKEGTNKFFKDIIPEVANGVLNNDQPDNETATQKKFDKQTDNKMGTSSNDNAHFESSDSEGKDDNKVKKIKIEADENEMQKSDEQIDTKIETEINDSDVEKSLQAKNISSDNENTLDSAESSQTPAQTSTGNKKQQPKSATSNKDEQTSLNSKSQKAKKDDFEDSNDEKKADNWDENNAREFLNKLIAKNLPSTPPSNPSDPKNPYSLDIKTKEESEDFLDKLNPGYPKESSYKEVVFRMHGINGTFSIVTDKYVEVIQKLIPYYSKVTFDVNAANPLKETIRCVKIGRGIPAMLESYVEKYKVGKTKKELLKEMKNMINLFLSNVDELVSGKSIQGKRLSDFPEHMQDAVKKVHQYSTDELSYKKFMGGFNSKLNGLIEQALNTFGIQ